MKLLLPASTWQVGATTSRYAHNERNTMRPAFPRREGFGVRLQLNPGAVIRYFELTNVWGGRKLRVS